MDSVFIGIIVMVAFGAAVFVVHAMQDAARTKTRRAEALQRARVFKFQSGPDAGLPVTPRRVSQSFGRR